MDFKEEALKPKDIREIILNTREPLRIQNVMKSDLTSWNLRDWEAMLKKALLTFRCGNYKYTNEPQWEASCLNKRATFEDFLSHIDAGSEEWWYFDYKYLCEWFTDREVLKEKIDWSLLGFPEITANESTIWIGSKGAHTPCHMDTYGCNLILQVCGRKQWVLFSPEQNLRPTRIPFEESSIYSQLNFFSPTQNDDFKGISHCRKVVLDPGDVLVLPYRWWHYVENLDTAISINVWLPLPEDDLARIKESIATIFVGQMTGTKEECRNIVLNPNMKEDMVTSDEALDIISATLHKCKPKNKVQKIGDQPGRNQEDQNYNIEEILSRCKCISKIPRLNEKEFKLFLDSQLQRFSITEKCDEGNTNLKCKKLIDFLEVITDEEVLSLIARKLIEKL